QADSLMIMESMNQLQQDLQLMLYPREFYERPRIREFAAYLAEEFERSHVTPLSADLAEETELEDELETDFQTFATPIAKPKTSATFNDRLPGIVFILSSPRSGSTLLRVMLAGHPHLLSTPELHLLPFETMAERAKDLSLSNLGEGLQKVLMDLKGLGLKASQSLIQDLVQRSLPIQNVYAMLQDLAGSRLLIDKSPTYAMSLETLGRAEEIFTDAKYIHLVRHPYAMIESFVRMRMDKLIGSGDSNPYRVAEKIWTRSNQNVLQFAQTLGSDRHHLVHYEDLVNEPQKVMRSICTFLGVPFDPSVLQPYEGQRMTDGLHQQSLSLGDPNFLKHNRVEKALGDAWRRIRLPHQLGNFARHITLQLGYELPELETVKAEPGAMLEETTITLGDLDLCLCTWGPKEGPLVLCLHGILEQGAVWDPVATQLAEQGYRVVAPDLRGHGRSGHAATYQLQDFLADLDQLVHQLTDQPVILIGHSLGSVVTALFASVRPECVQQLILIETILPGTEDKTNPANQLLTHLEYVAAPPEHIQLPDIKAAAVRLQQATSSLSPAFAQLLANRATQTQGEGVQWRWDPILRTRTSLRGAPFNRDGYLQLLQQIKAPVTLVYGNRSRFNRPQDLADQQAALPNADRVMLSGGHNIHLDAASELAQQLLDRLPLASDAQEP
ncbi:MAG: alpha/beta fold hydrolase, partial [Thermosynechococcaceae cyanobacterium]